MVGRCNLEAGFTGIFSFLHFFNISLIFFNFSSFLIFSSKLLNDNAPLYKKPSFVMDNDYPPWLMFPRFPLKFLVVIVSFLARYVGFPDFKIL